MFALARSPFARMLAVLFVEQLIARGYLAPEEASAAVEDAMHIIGYIAMVITLLIWQWRASHPAKQQVDAALGETTVTITEPAGKTSSFINRILSAFFVKPS